MPQLTIAMHQPIKRCHGFAQGYSKVFSFIFLGPRMR